MNIGFVVNHPTQFEVPFYQYVQKLNAGNSFDVFYLENNQSSDHFDKELGRFIKWGIDLYGGYAHFLLEGKNKTAALEPFLKQKKYDLIVVNGYKNQYAGFAELCRKNGIPVALRMDTVLFNQSPVKILLRKLLLKKVYKQFDHFLVTGKVSRDYLHEMGVADANIHVFSYCTDNDFFGKKGEGKLEAAHLLRNQLNIGNRQVILTVAKFMKRESPWDVLKAFTRLNRKDIALVIVGDGEERQLLENYVAGFPHLTIHFAGYVPYTQLPSYYHISTLFVHAAQDEPWGVSVQEAIGAGCRVVCSDKVGAAFDMIHNGANGATYRFGNDGELASALERVLLIEESKVEEANNKVLEWWNYETMWNELMAAAKAQNKKQT